MRKFILLALVVLGSFYSVAQDDKSPDIRMLADGNNEFAVDMYMKLKNGYGNIFFSPYSISTALAITCSGARGNTEKEIAGAMHFAMEQKQLNTAFAKFAESLAEIQKNGRVNLLTANSIWLHSGYKILPEFTDACEKSYGVGIMPVDFNLHMGDALKSINSWVAKKTNNKIVDVVDKLDPLTRLVLVNVIYFKGFWKVHFDRRNTLDMPFYLQNGQFVRVPMMFKEHGYSSGCGYAETDDVQILVMPYKGDEISMWIILPKNRDGLPKVEEALSFEQIKAWFSKNVGGEVNVYIPRFQFSYGSVSLVNPLRELGIKDAFAIDKSDFSGMTGNRELYISNIFHKAYVNVNEEGTEAAAATAVAGGAAGVEEIKVFKADHPFIFIIRENITGVILFMGRYVDPKNRTEPGDY